MMMVSSPGQLTAIDEMPSGNGATPLSESRAESPSGVDQPPSFHTYASASPNLSSTSSSSVKGKEKERERESEHLTASLSSRSSDERRERQAARNVGCSTPGGKHDPLTGA